MNKTKSGNAVIQIVCSLKNWFEQITNVLHDEYYELNRVPNLKFMKCGSSWTTFSFTLETIVDALLGCHATVNMKLCTTPASDRRILFHLHSCSRAAAWRGIVNKQQRTGRAGPSRAERYAATLRANPFKLNNIYEITAHVDTVSSAKLNILLAFIQY